MKKFYTLTLLVLSASGLLGLESSSAYAKRHKAAVEKNNPTPASSVTSAIISGDRVALVIGNAAYAYAPLDNPVNDATDVAEKLRGLGFDVVERHNVKMREIGSILSEFSSKLKPGSVALVFYAGHGLQIKGENYFPVVDAEIRTEMDVPNQSISVKQIMDVLEDSKTKLNLVFLDACRDNPYARSFRSSARGLAKVIAPTGTLISYATRPGSTAADGEGKNGLYTSKLLKQFESNQPIELALKAVVSEVKAASQGKQEPWMEGSIEGEFCFKVCVPINQQPTPAVDPASVELSFWNSIKDSKNPADFQAYLDTYPNGKFAALAKVRAKPPEVTPTPVPQPTPAPNPASVELSFWNSIKDSSNPADFQAYLDSYPSGKFAALAKNRLNPPPTSAKPVPQTTTEPVNPVPQPPKAVAVTANFQKTSNCQLVFFNQSELIEKDPRSESAKRRLEQEFSPRDKQLVAQQQEITRLEEKLNKERSIMGNAQYKKLEAEIIAKKRDAMKRQKEFSNDFSLRRNEELTKLQSLYKEIIKHIEDERGIFVLLDGVVYFSDRLGLTNALISDGIQISSNTQKQLDEISSGKCQAATLDISKILEKHPQAEAAKRQLEQEFSPRDKQLVAQQQEIAKLEENFNKNASRMSNGEKRNLEAEIMAKKHDVSRRQKEFSGDFEIRRNEELGKLQKKILHDIGVFANQNDLDMIAEKSENLKRAASVINIPDVTGDFIKSKGY